MNSSDINKTDINMSVKIAGVEWKNPVTVASGTFGSGAEYSEFVDLNKLGAVTTKGVADKPWEGNPTPRVAEVYGGMLNAVGLQNPGIELFCKRDIPFLKKYDTKIVVNVCGHSAEEYINVVKRLADEPIDMMEINISCPNVKEGGIAFGTDPKGVEAITKEVKKYAKQPVIMKLSPNVTSIAEIAKAAEAGGADAVSLINTITGMKIDINRRKFVLANKTGGMSGPAVHPVAVRMVYETANAVNIPIIGMGGITNAADAIEMILAGATAVSVGTANFVNPKTTEQIVDGIAEYLENICSQHVVLWKEEGVVRAFMTWKDHFNCENLEAYPDSCYLTTLCVWPDYRGQGISEVMYAEAEKDIAAKFPGSRITLRTWSTNGAQEHILDKLGYSLVRRLKDDRGAGIDTVYFVKKEENEKNDR